MDRADYVNLPAGKIQLQRQDRLGRSTSMFQPVNIPSLKSLAGPTVCRFQQPTFEYLPRDFFGFMFPFQVRSGSQEKVFRSKTLA